MSPGSSNPSSTTLPNGTRGAWRLVLVKRTSSGTRLYLVYALLGHFYIGRVALDPDPMPPQLPGDRARCPRAEERIQHDVPLVRTDASITL